MSLQHVDKKIVENFDSRFQTFLKMSDTVEKDDFVFTTFMLVNKEGWFVCTNSRVCTVLEKMMPTANSASVGCILKAFSKNFDSVFNTKFAHHVLHAAIMRCADAGVRRDPIVESCLEDYMEYMWENYPTHLHRPHGAPALRMYLQLMAGVLVSKSKQTGQYEATSIELADALDPLYLERITDLTNRFLLSNEFNEFVVDELVCPFLQVLLIVDFKRLTDNFDDICSHILQNSILLKDISSDSSSTSEIRGDRLPIGFTNEIAVFLLEVLLSLLPGKPLLKFIRKHLFGVDSHLAASQKNMEVLDLSLVSSIATHPVACRVLRSAINSVKKETDLKMILNVLKKSGASEVSVLRMALNNGQHYLLTSLSKVCRNQSSESVQSLFEQAILDTFGYSLKVKKHDSRLIRSIVSLSPSDALKNCPLEEASTDPHYSAIIELNSVSPEKPESQQLKRPLQLSGTGLTTINLAGCLLAEDMLMFSYHRPIRLSSSLLMLSAQELDSWARHSMLSRVVETALSSSSVPVEHKQKLFNVLKPQLSSLVFDACGSRLIEAAWRSFDSFPDCRSVKEDVVQLLVHCSDRLANSKFGHFVENLVATKVYRDNPERWRRAKLPASSQTKSSKSVVHSKKHPLQEGRKSMLKKKKLKMQ